MEWELVLVIITARAAGEDQHKYAAAERAKTVMCGPTLTQKECAAVAQDASRHTNGDSVYDNG